MINEDLSEPSLIQAPNELSAYFKDMKLECILNEWEKHHGSWTNAKLDGYLDGESVPISSEEISNLPEMNKSFRLTNVQLYVPQITQFCREFKNKTGHVLGVNFYYTPHSEAQCFIYHQDSQHSFCYQLLGEKDWTFLRYQGNFLRETHEQEHVLNMIKKGKLIAEEQMYKMQEGSLLEFPYCLIHKARNESSSPSAHLTFSYSAPTMGEFAIHCAESLLGLKITEKYLDRIQLENIKNSLQKFDGDPQRIYQSYMKKFIAQQELKSTEGRPY
jgi:ribosomal protein L16 Arg81 hydroxylase